MERKAREQGLKQGIEHGKALGLAKGKKEGRGQAVREFSECFRKLGVD